MVDHGKYIKSAVRLYEIVLLMSHLDLLLTHSFGVFSCCFACYGTKHI